MINKKILIKNINKIKLNLKKRKFLIKIKKLMYLIKKFVYLKIINFLFIKNNIIKKLYKFYFKYFKIKLNKVLIKIPNIVNFKCYKNCNIIIKKWGKSKISNLNHIQIIKKFKNYKNKFNKLIILNDPLLELYKALIKFIIKTNKMDHNFLEVNSNYILKFKELINSGQLPIFKNELFSIDKINYLLPTSEISLINLFKNKLINEKELPIKLISQTKCFRNEKKNYGKKNKGLLRQNEFDKIELILITDIKNSYKDILNILKFSEKLLKSLKLKYRIIMLSNDDINFSSSQTYDLELWSPYLKKYIEISSTTNTESFQSIRLNLKYKFNNNLINNHIINSSSLAIGRLFAILLENYNNIYGIKIPKVLRNYLNNKSFFYY